MGTAHWTSYRSNLLLFSPANVMETLILPNINKYILTAPDQHDFRPKHSANSALLQLVTDIAEEASRSNGMHGCRFICCVDTVTITTCCQRSIDHRSLLARCECSFLYKRKTSQSSLLQRVKSTSRKVNTGTPQCSIMSPSLFSLYIVDVPRPTYPVKRFCYADDLTVWALWVNIPDLDVSHLNVVHYNCPWMAYNVGPVLFLPQAHGWLNVVIHR